jgi:hypothetical protein
MRITEALVAPAAAVSEVAWRVAVDGTPRVLAGLAAAASGGKPMRLTAHDVRVALGRPGGEADDPAPFAWSTRTAQRSLGLAAVESLLFGTSRSPVDAVREVVADAVRRGGGGTQPPSRLDRWLAGLPPAGRAAVGAAAVTWATRLWCAVDWDALPTPLVIGRDHWWHSPDSALLALRSRAEVRCGSAHLVVLTGERRASARQELSLVTLVEALRARDGAPPLPVVGWWPDSGHLVRVDSEPAVLDMAVAGIGAVLRSRRRVAA